MVGVCPVTNRMCVKKKRPLSIRKLIEKEWPNTARIIVQYKTSTVQNFLINEWQGKRKKRLAPSARKAG